MNSVVLIEETKPSKCRLGKTSDQQRLELIFCLLQP